MRKKEESMWYRYPGLRIRVDISRSHILPRKKKDPYLGTGSDPGETNQTSIYFFILSFPFFFFKKIAYQTYQDILSATTCIFIRRIRHCYGEKKNKPIINTIWIQKPGSEFVTPDFSVHRYNVRLKKKMVKL